MKGYAKKSRGIDKGEGFYKESTSFIYAQLKKSRKVEKENLEWNYKFSSSLLFRTQQTNYILKVCNKLISINI